MTYRDYQPDSFFLGYQRRWIADMSRLKLMEKSRQIGISWCTAYALVRRKARAGQRLDAWVSSRDAVQARLFKEDCVHFAELLDLGAKDLGVRVVNDAERATAHVLHFANGRRIHSMASSPNAQAGKRGDRVLDEFALHRDPRELWAIAYPGITWGGSLEAVSTHRGSHNFFNRLLIEARERGNPKGISLHRVTLQDALEEGLLAKLKEKLPAKDPRHDMDEAAYFDLVRSGCADEESFQQEYMCQPADDASAFLSYDLIASCEYPDEEPWDTNLARCPNPVYVGVDVGRDHDLTVIWALERVGDVHFTRRLVELKAETFEAQEHALDEVLSLPCVRRCCIDATGIGRQFAERARSRHGRHRVEEVRFTAAVKEDLAYPVRTACELGRLRIPPRPEIRSDLRAIRKETTASGNLRFTADRGRNGHADRFWALALALHASGLATTAGLGARSFAPADIGTIETDLSGMF
jgi:phage FluMu gp28-like protein